MNKEIGPPLNLDLSRGKKSSGNRSLDPYAFVRQLQKATDYRPCEKFLGAGCIAVVWVKNNRAVMNVGVGVRCLEAGCPVTLDLE